MRNLKGLAPRYSKDNPPPGHTQKHPNGYFTPLLKRLLEKNINLKGKKGFERFNEIFKGKLTAKQIIALRYILNACQGETQSIEGIIDRIDGKIATNTNGKGTYATTVIVRIGNQSGLLSPQEQKSVTIKADRV